VFHKLLIFYFQDVREIPESGFIGQSLFDLLIVSLALNMIDIGKFLPIGRNEMAVSCFVTLFDKKMNTHAYAIFRITAIAASIHGGHGRPYFP
jgi:hypothetical protein